jgi:hypothetical protein
MIVVYQIVMVICDSEAKSKKGMPGFLNVELPRKCGK